MRREPAPRLGLAHRNGVNTYRDRYLDLSPPAKAHGHDMFWVPADIIAWLEHPGHPRRPAGPATPSGSAPGRGMPRA